MKELIAHIVDTERVMGYRALVGLRMDEEAVLPNMDQDIYVANRDVSSTTLQELIEEFVTVRKSTILLFKGANEKHLSFMVKTQAGNVTALALAYIMMGHALHHLGVLQERYV